MKKIIFSFITICLQLSLLFPHTVIASTHAVGTNIKTTDGTIYLISPDGTKRPYNSEGAFLSYGFNAWSSVKTATAEDIALPTGLNIPPQDGKIICDTKDRIGTCFLISTGWKTAFPSLEIFNQQGFSFKKALYGDVSFLPERQNIQSGSSSHSPGVVINKGGTLYLVGENGLIGIPSMSIFYSWGYKLSDVVIANGADFSLTISGNLKKREAGELNPLASYWAPTDQKTIITAVPDTYASAELSYTNNTTLKTGTKGAELFAFKIYAPKNSPITIAQLDFDYSGTLAPSYLSNVKIFNLTNGTQIAKDSGLSSQYTSIGYVINPSINIPAGGFVEIGMIGDIASGLSGYTYQPKLTQVWTLDGSNKASYATVKNVPLTGVLLTTTADTTIYPTYSKKLMVTSPTNGDVITVGTLKQITWTTSASNYENVSITLLRKTDTGSYVTAQTLTTSTPNNGSYFWSVSTSLPTGLYYVYINNSDSSIYDDSDGDFTISNPNILPTTSSSKDSKRLADIRQFAAGLELYYNDFSKYPSSLSQLYPTYTYTMGIATAPTPTEGTCTESQNNYTYTQLGVGQSYMLTFCLGNSTGGYSAGVHALTQTGIQ